MPKTALVIWSLALVASGLAGRVSADIVCPDSSYVCVDFTRTYINSYHRGEPYDYVTVVPSGAGESFSVTGISIRVYLKDCSGAPLIAVPAEQILLFSSSLCICPGGNVADAPTDSSGCANFSHTLAAGGCTTELTCIADGVSLGVVARNGRCGTLADLTTVKINSADTDTASPCYVDASDLADLASRMGRPDRYTICSDLNESGFIDASDLAFHAALRGAFCR